MSRRNNIVSVLGIALGVAAVSGSVLLSSRLMPKPVLAHQVQVSGNVGGTLHIEPNDTPRSGVSAFAWFALTRRGGQAIPLSVCNCELAIYAHPVRSGDVPLAQPSLRAVSQDGYQGIPGANVTFPRAGSYDVVLRGRPVTSGLFTPFELRFAVTVAR